MKSEDVQRCIEQAMEKAGLKEGQRPKLLSDNGSCYVASEQKVFLQNKSIIQVHGKLNHPQTQDKIERYPRSMKNVVKLDHHYCPEELNTALEKFVHYYNHERYHESLNNVTPADMYYGKRERMLKRREKIKKQSMAKRKELYLIEKLKI